MFVTPDVRTMQLNYMLGGESCAVEKLINILTFSDYFILTNIFVKLPKDVQIKFVRTLAQRL